MSTTNGDGDGPFRVDGYIRVSDSSGRQGPGYHTKEEQREQIERYCERKGWDLVKVWTEEDVSGKRIKRKGAMPTIIERCIRREISGVVVLRINRFGRNQMEGLNAIHDMWEAGARLVGAEDGFDTSDINVRRYVVPTMLGLAETKIDEGRANAKATARNCFARGVFQGRTPFGYTRNGTYVDGELVARADAALDGRALVPDPVTGPIVTQLFEDRAKGATLHALRTWLNAEGVTTTQGATWTSNGVKLMIARDVYLGTIHSRGKTKEKAHKALTDPATFRRAQRSGQAPLRNPERSSLLSGLARCAGCSYALARNHLVGENLDLYTCRRMRTNGDCPDPLSSVGLDRLNRYVVEEFWEFMDQTFERAGEESRLPEIRGRLDLARAERLHWVRDKRPAMVGGQEVYDEGLIVRAADVEAIEREYEDELRRLDQPAITGDVRQLRQDWEEGRIPLEEQRRLLGLAITAVMVRRPANGHHWHHSHGLSDRVYIAFRPERLDLPRMGRGVKVSRPLTFRFPGDAEPA